MCISHLPADHSSIVAVPRVITHSTPGIIDAHFYSALIWIGASHQTNITIYAGCWEHSMQNSFHAKDPPFDFPFLPVVSVTSNVRATADTACSSEFFIVLIWSVSTHWSGVNWLCPAIPQVWKVSFTLHTLLCQQTITPTINFLIYPLRLLNYGQSIMHTLKHIWSCFIVVL